jgi:hypothetical protein
VTADADDVLRRPSVRLSAGHFELDRKRLLPVAGLLHESVHAIDERLSVVFGGRSVGCPFFLHVAAIEEHARSSILRDIGGAEIFSEQPESSLPPQVDLPQAVAGGVIALQEECVFPVGCVDMGNAPEVDDDLGRRV